MIRTLYPHAAGGRLGLALLAVRAAAGVGFIFHGSFKIGHAASWMGPHAFAPHWLQAIVAVAEFYGGFALIAGLFTVPLAAILSADLLVAILKVHVPMGAHYVGGRLPLEVPVTYLAILIALLLAGPGAYSLDALFFSRRR